MHVRAKSSTCAGPVHPIVIRCPRLYLLASLRTSFHQYRQLVLCQRRTIADGAQLCRDLTQLLLSGRQTGQQLILPCRLPSGVAL